MFDLVLSPSFSSGSLSLALFARKLQWCLLAFVIAATSFSAVNEFRDRARKSESEELEKGRENRDVEGG
jgi:hypothetical protein